MYVKYISLCHAQPKCLSQFFKTSCVEESKQRGLTYTEVIFQMKYPAKVERERVICTCPCHTLDGLAALDQMEIKSDCLHQSWHISQVQMFQQIKPQDRCYYPGVITGSAVKMCDTHKKKAEVRSHITTTILNFLILSGRYTCCSLSQ